MKKHLVILCSTLLSFVSASSIAQVSDPQVLMTVGNRPVTLTEFKSMYYKNLPADSVKSQKALDNYIKLFTEFRLKVNAAIDAKLDTTASFKQEMGEYRGKLAEPYMQDQAVANQLVKESYDRMQYDIKASHILIKVGPDASPQDTLAAYKKIAGLREKIMKKEITFEKAAEENSDDTYSKVRGGDLGYFTSLEMVYPFESAAYNTKVGEVSMPVRTQYGYHIIKVMDKRADAGQILVAHIMLRTPPHTVASDSTKLKSKIDSIYTLIQQGQNFADLARKFSQDPSSGKVGGTLKWFGVGRMPPQFEQAAFALKNIGDVSMPVKTNFGWHIIKLLGKKGIPAIDSVKDQITSRIQKDSRSQEATDALVKEVQKKYAFKEYPEAKKAFYKVVDSSFYKGKWSMENAKKLTSPIISFGTVSVNQEEFAKYLMHNQMTGENKGGEYAVNMLYPKFVKEQTLKFKSDQLEREFPAFAEMLLEYRDGILLFDITDKMVWSKALKDTTGLKKFYADHMNDYMAPSSDVAHNFTCDNSKVAKKVKDLLKEGKVDKDILSAINGSDPKTKLVQVEVLEKTPGQDAIKAGVSDGATGKDGKPVVVNMVKVAAHPKKLDEARGMVTTDYQNYLMTQWLADLKAKYPVQIDQKVLSQVLPR